MSGTGLHVGLESLESRTLLSGNVTASVVDGDLVIAGDAARNRILVTGRGLNAGEVLVRSGDDSSTTVNGQYDAILTGVTGAIRIHLGAGADTLNFQDLSTPGGLRVDGGRGGDRVAFNRIAVAGRTNVLGQRGDDSITALQSTFAGASKVRGDEGDDRVLLDGCTFNGRAVVLGGAGQDAFNVDASTFNAGHVVNGQTGRDRVVDAIEADYLFTSRKLGWQAGFSDYPVGREADWELDSGLRTPPAELNWPGKGFLLSGNNHSDDLFMFLKRQLGPEQGLKPNTAYQVRFEISYGTDAPTGGGGIGGSPGDSVFLKAGATTNEPLRVVNADNDWRMNIDKSDQASDGRDVTVIGPITHGVSVDDAGDPPTYREVRRTHVHPTTVKTDANGRLWVIIGTDSGFEGTTTLYVRGISLRLLPA